MPVSTLRDPAGLKRHTLVRETGAHAVEIDVPYFDIDGEQVWGATAMVLSELLAALEGGVRS